MGDPFSFYPDSSFVTTRQPLGSLESFESISQHPLVLQVRISDILQSDSRTTVSYIIVQIVPRMGPSCNWLGSYCYMKILHMIGSYPSPF
jgi:hypothetical protein